MVSANTTSWVVASGTHSCNMIMLGLFRAEAAPMHARRYDFVAQATVHVLMFFGAYLIKFGHTRHLTDGLFHSYAHMFFWPGRRHTPLHHFSSATYALFAGMSWAGFQ